MLYRQLETRLREVVASRIAGARLDLIQVRPCPDPRFGDYQSNALISLAKEKGMNPRKLAEEVATTIDVSAWCDPVEVAGPGFLNFRLKNEALGRALGESLKTGVLFFEKTTKPRTIVVDFSSPNVAKAMHVGHIRSTILGDSLARILRLLGHRVITDNHLGDWGTQFGKLLVGWKELLDHDALRQDPIAEMERLYKEIHAAGEKDPAVLDKARQELVKLQQGDVDNLELWKEMIFLSQAAFQEIYQRLGVKFDHALGESFYNPFLKKVVEDLRQKEIARESEGALVVFFEEPALKENPAIVQKSDGAANYTTTDLATLQYRLENWKPDEIIYVTDSRQQLHFRQLFTLFKRWRPEVTTRLFHVWFGTILGEDGKPFKTKSGTTIKLAGLLDEAEERAYQVVEQKNPELTQEQKTEIARVVGIGALKYADLLPNRQSDYVFSWDKMLALTGNTAVYLLYAYTRIQSIFRKGEVEAPSGEGDIEIRAVEEVKLSKQLLQFGLVLEAVAEEHRPNYLCNYLYDLAGDFARFYEACPVLKAEEPQRRSRLALCRLTAAVLKQGLDVLGIETTEVM